METRVPDNRIWENAISVSIGEKERERHLATVSRLTFWGVWWGSFSSTGVGKYLHTLFYSCMFAGILHSPGPSPVFQCPPVFQFSTGSEDKGTKLRAPSVEARHLSQQYDLFPFVRVCVTVCLSQHVLVCVCVCVLNQMHTVI